MSVKYASLRPYPATPAPLLLPSPFPQIISCRTISNMASFRRKALRSRERVHPSARGVFADRGVTRYFQCLVRSGVCFKIYFASTVPARDVEHHPVRDIHQWCEIAGPPMAAAGHWSLHHGPACRVIAAGYSGTEQLTVTRATRLDSRHAANW